MGGKSDLCLCWWTCLPVDPIFGLHSGMRFSDCIGQQDVSRRLAAAYREGRVAHAQLFLGPEGSGNLAVALAYAQFLFCPNKSESDSCGACPTCRKMETLQYADLFFSYPVVTVKGRKEPPISEDYASDWRETLLGQGPYLDIDHWLGEISEEGKQGDFTVREALSIIRKMNMKGYESPLKIMIIWMAERMKTETANKLLKLLEEPPENSLFFLVANQSDQMLATVMSRVQVIRVNRISDEAILDQLVERGVNPERAAAVAHYSAGNWWRALGMVGEGDDGTDLFERFSSWMRCCYKGMVPEIFQWSNATAELTREQQKQFLQYSLEQIRQNIVLNYAGPDLTRMNEGEREFSRRFSPFIHDLNAVELMNELGKAHLDISRNVNSRIVLADLSLKVSKLLASSNR